ncbi:ExeA family protein [Thalassolituus sp. LLYu03]|uniref:ExeA family protein n=1 Tax=Thalassolituus sp. LLYu03 TaxID=3421656 RepID=UPI003D2D7BEF
MQLSNLSSACEQFYGLSQPAFGLTPNTEFYVDLPTQKNAFETLLFALGSGEGFVKITGEVGTGKTLLCRRLLNALNTPDVCTVYVPSPDVSQESLWRVIARELGPVDDACGAGQAEFTNETQVRDAIQQRLLALAADHIRVILIIDEAQCMPVATLETLRLISNLETERQKLVQIVLFGQPELNTVLAREDLRQLRQRITWSAELSPLSDASVLSVYLQQRLSVAGYRGLPLFAPEALKALWQASRGVPRLVNILAAKSLLAGYGSGSRLLGKEHVLRAAADTEGSFPAVASSAGWRLQALAAALLLVAL